MLIYQFYSVLILIHVISVIVWLGFFPVELNLIKSIKKEINIDIKTLLINKLLSLKNLTGMIGSIGILLTGILMVLISPFYNFFEFKANHWLTTKQILFILILIITFVIIIPVSKKIRNSHDSKNEQLFDRFIKWTFVEKSLVFVNFLLGFLHKYYF